MGIANYKQNNNLMCVIAIITDYTYIATYYKLCFELIQYYKNPSPPKASPNMGSHAHIRTHACMGMHHDGLMHQMQYSLAVSHK